LVFQQALQPVAVAVNVAGFPAIPKLAAVAVSVLLPNAGPTLQLLTVATPLGFVVVLLPVTLPPPEVTAKVTETLGTGLPFRSLSATAGGRATAVPAGAR
jgi:hypothetical protein